MENNAIPEDDFDWRIEDMGRVAGGPLTGRRVLLVGEARHPTYGRLSFTMPNPAALALNIGINTAVMAESLWPRLEATEARDPSGQRTFQIRNDRLHDFYTFVEQNIIAVTMSFQALEVFANTIIGRRAKGNIQVERRKGIKNLTPDEAERYVSTEDKLSQVIPTLMNVANPMADAVWPRFKELKNTRDEAVHWKSRKAFSNYQRREEQTLFYIFLNTDAQTYPNTAIAVLDYFYAAGRPRWLKEAKALSDKYKELGGNV